MKLIERDNIKPTFPVTDGVFVGELIAPSASLRCVRPTELCGSFRGLNTFLDFVRDMQGTRSYTDSDSYNSGFNHFRTFAAAMDAYRNNPSSVCSFKENDTHLSDDGENGNMVDYETTGSFIDIGRFLEGVPEAFGFMREGNPSNRRVNIYLNLGWVHFIEPDVINARSSRIVRLIDWLEAQQVRVQLTCIASGDNSHTEIVIKEHDEPLDVNDIAVVSHTDFFRRAIFRFREYSKKVTSDYGSSADFSDSVSDKTFYPDNNSEFSIFIDSIVNDTKKINTEFDALETWFQEALTANALEPEARTKSILDRKGRSAEGQIAGLRPGGIFNWF